ncbi:hypothetical protein DL93DRAFT_2165735 [Clavulina sp. PMI_390]|nr:hypothetical protein DL93DRAFT_2165735 [Clavulina sp. PMI_390]
MASAAKNPVQPSIVFPDADITLRSDDLMLFHVNKAVLREASQHFRSMFTITPPDSQENQVLDVHVSGAALLLLLQSGPLYHFTLANLSPTVDEVLAAIQAADKLEFDLAVSKLKRGPLVAALAAEPNPLRAWAIAQAYQLPNAAKAASYRFFLSQDDFKSQWRHIPELARVNAMEFNTLIWHREQTTKALRTEACETVWVRDCEACRGYAEELSWLDPADLQNLPPEVEGKRALESILEDPNGPHPVAMGKDGMLMALSLVTLKTTCDECKKISKASQERLKLWKADRWKETMEQALKDGEPPIWQLDKISDHELSQD